VLRSAHVESFHKLLVSEIGQQLEMASALLRRDVCEIFATRKIIFAEKHLG
jgi:hypothetical protein